MTLRPTSSRSRSSASSVCPALRNRSTASCSWRSAVPVSRWKPYSSPRACSTASSASDNLPSASTVVSSRSGRVRSMLTRPSCGAASSDARDTAQLGGVVDQLLGEPASVRGRAVGAEQAAGEVHAVDDQVDLGGQVVAVAGQQLVGQPLQPRVQLELVVGGGAACRVLRVVVLAADVGERAAAETGAGDLALDVVDDGEQRGPRVAVAAGQFGVDEREDGCGLAGQVGADQLVLALEQPVDRHLAQAGLADQLVHADAARAAGREEALGGVEDDRLPLGAAAANRGRGVVGGGEFQGGGHVTDA